jgi:hypothetical protein
MTTHRHSVSGKYSTYTNVPIPDLTPLTDRVTTLEAQVKTLLLAVGGSGGGTTPPPPAPVGTPTLLGPTDTVTDFLAACADMSLDTIELAAGTYSWDGAQIGVDRTSRPLTVQAAVGASPRFVGSGGASYGIFGFGSAAGVAAKYVTLNLANCLFDGITLSMAGVFAVFGSDYCSILRPTLQNLKRGGSATQPYHSWVAYISAPYGPANDHLTLDGFTLRHPNVRRDVSAFQVASSGSHGAITIKNVYGLDQYYYAGYFGRPISNLQLDNWTITDSGSVRFTATVIDGAYSNLHATSSDPLVNDSTGTMTNGGGNSGI